METSKYWYGVEAWYSPRQCLRMTRGMEMIAAMRIWTRPIFLWPSAWRIRAVFCHYGKIPLFLRLRLGKCFDCSPWNSLSSTHQIPGWGLGRGYHWHECSHRHAACLWFEENLNPQIVSIWWPWKVAKAMEGRKSGKENSKITSEICLCKY